MTTAGIDERTLQQTALDRRVVPIDERVRVLLGLFAGLYPNYEQAARALGVSKDTIAKYFEGNPNMAFYVFENMIRLLRQKAPENVLRRHLREPVIDEIRRSAQVRNGQQTDAVMYEITPELLKVLEFYREQFPSRARAARELDINPRTFKAYVKGDIRSFPRNKFESLRALLAERGIGDKEILKVSGAASWEDLLRERGSQGRVEGTKEALLADLRQRFEDETLVEDVCEDDSLAEQAKKHFGGLEEAVRAAVKGLEQEADERLAEDLDKGRFAPAFKELRRLEHAIKLYAQAMGRLNGRKGAKGWKDEVVEMSRRKNRHKGVIFEALGLKSGTETGSLEEEVGEPRTYSSEQSYEPGEIVLHPDFGLGRVVRVVEDRRFVVTFGPQVGEKMFIMNERGYRPEFGSMR